MEKKYSIKEKQNLMNITLLGDQSYVKIFNSEQGLIRHSRSKGATQLRQVVQPGQYKIVSDGTINKINSTYIKPESVSATETTSDKLKQDISTDQLIVPLKQKYIKGQQITGTISGNGTESIMFQFSGKGFERPRMAHVFPVTVGSEISWSSKISRETEDSIRYSLEITNHTEMVVEYSAKIMEIS